MLPVEVSTPAVGYGTVNTTSEALSFSGFALKTLSQPIRNTKYYLGMLVYYLKHGANVLQMGGAEEGGLNVAYSLH